MKGSLPMKNHSHQVATDIFQTVLKAVDPYALIQERLVSIQCNPVMIAFYNRLKDKGKNG
jgi:hypothetical protein